MSNKRLRKQTSFVTANRNQNKYTPKRCILFVHGDDFSNQDVLINTQAFPYLVSGDVIEIATQSSMRMTTSSGNLNQQQQQSSTTSHDDENSANSQNDEDSTPDQPQQPSPPKMQAPVQLQQQQDCLMLKISMEALQPTKGVQFLSVLKSIADLYGLVHRKEVYVRCVKPDRARLDYIELTMRDHFISRSDMYRFSLFLSNKSVFALKHIHWNGYSAQIKDLIRKQQMGVGNEPKNLRVSAGLCGHEHTKITFRSRSAILYWLFQMSKEMWEYTTAHEYEDGNMHFEKAVNGFVKEIFDRWNALDVNHSLCMIFFSRHYITEEIEVNDEKSCGETNSYWDQESSSHIIESKDGRKYIDVYKVVDWNETQNMNPQDMLVRLKQEFIAYPNIIRKIVSKKSIQLTNSSAADGNFLEAVNLVLNAYDMYYANRDLTRTGQEIVVISAGVGLYNIENAGLSRITTKRLMDIGLSVDLICLGQPPLHSVPIFRIAKYDQLSRDGRDYFFYRSPDWINISFYLGNLGPKFNNGFLPTCKTPSILNRYRFIDTKLPKLPDIPITGDGPIKDFESHDDDVFASEISAPVSPTSSKVGYFKAIRVHSHDNLTETAEAKNVVSATADDIHVNGHHGLDLSKKEAVDLVSRPSQRPAKELFHMKLFNPFDIDNSDDIKSPTSLQHKNQQNTFHRRRWAHLHPSSSGLRPTQKAEYIKHFLLRINWQSLSEPACLPLTTDYWPRESALNNRAEFELNTYNVLDHQDRYSNISMLMRELVLQRLHEGFQVYVPDLKSREISTTPTVTQTSEPSISNTTDAGRNRSSSLSEEITAIKLASANQFHHIFYGPDKKSIIVNRYISRDQNNMKLKSHNTSETNETESSATPDNRSIYNYKYLLWNSTLSRLENKNIRFCSQVSYNWNKLDQLISGFHDEMNEALHNRSHEYHLIPITNSNRKYLATSAMHTISSHSSAPNLGSSPYSPTEGSPASYDSAIFNTSSSFNLPSSLDYNDALVKTRIKSFRKFKEIFVSRNFKLAKLDNTKNDVHVEIVTQEMMELQEYSQRKHPGMNVAKLEKIPSEENMDREEWFHLHYKPTYHPAETFCIKIQWLVCSASLIGDYIQSLARRAARFNFALIQTPVDTSTYVKYINRIETTTIDHGFSQTDQNVFDDELHPFRTFVNIILPAEEDIVHVIKQRLCHPPFNFFPEHVPAKFCRKFVHESGCIILEFGNKSVVWIDNPFYTLPKKQLKFNAMDLLQKVQLLCNSQETSPCSATPQYASVEHPYDFVDDHAQEITNGEVN